ncbi:ABC transporter permease [Lachnospiraceae bacterium]|uniref:ABC transporter permease n=1 Tax=Extibacter sp. GGCC_0201 TaxID=2731209 RepID=UPI001AA16FAC|nr:ABC transporter permease [Extibacter sp. GGCC_0201]MBO1721622.1 ABC transporter permease [Extibacter sp. GGCC_0201]BDF33978.1 ABC transporter permease [Lachnospiraceae bacterium]BDF37982.1 ABC transporter permease [Lachnospiraceae bacterium]
MIRNILKRDMKRRKSVNLILFLFITIATIFLASSVNNILVVTSSVEYYMDYANVPDINLVISGDSEKEKIAEWIDSQGPGVEEYDYNTLLSLIKKNVTYREDGEDKQLDFNGGVYLGTMDARYCYVYDQDGREFALEDDEAALSTSIMEGNGLKEGDRITVHVGGESREYRLKVKTKDAAFGSDMVGMTRLLVNQEEYARFAAKNDEDMIGLYYIDTSEAEQFAKELNKQNYSTVLNTVEKDMYTLVYSFDMIMAALLILIGICLILIALLVLRFTIVFTVEEDYREIGIMKAIGLKGPAIQKIYLTKYFVLVCCGALAGFAASVPVSRQMVAGVSKNMIMEDSSANLGVNLLCTAAVVIFVLLFCYSCTRRMNKISAISAIRDGHTGESFNRKKGLALHLRKRLPVPMYLGMNDMVRQTRRYFILMAAFCLSFILITIPLNTLNTMQSKEMAGKFAIDPESAAYVADIEQQGEGSIKTGRQLEKSMERVEDELADKGYKASLTGIPIYFFSYREKEGGTQSKIMTIQTIGRNTDYMTYQDGEAPLLEDEIAFSKKLLEENGWEIGDRVETEIEGERRNLLITGTYSDYMQIGDSARLNPEINLKDEPMFDCWNIMVDMKTDGSQEETVRELERELPGYGWSTAQEFVDGNVGGIQNSLQNLVIPMTGMLCGVIMLITLLMERLFVVREKGEIAMMKSIGFRNGSIKMWQVLRMAGVALVSMAAAVPLSLISNRWVLKPIFAIMGADVDIQVVPWQIYGVYPGILLAGIVTAAYLAAGKIKKIDIRELNNLE